MRQVGLFEAKNKLSALVDEAIRGDDVVITRHGKPVARLVAEPKDAAAQLREQRRRAAEDLLRHSRGITLGGISIKSLIEEGRE